jgi:hypothetical protein
MAEISAGNRKEGGNLENLRVDGTLIKKNILIISYIKRKGCTIVDWINVAQVRGQCITFVLYL